MAETIFMGLPEPLALPLWRPHGRNAVEAVCRRLTAVNNIKFSLEVE